MQADQPGPARFPSKRDAWLEVLLWIASLTGVAGGIAQLSSSAGLGVRLLFLLLSLGGVGLMLWVLYGTSYTFTAKTLLIRSGPFRFTVPLALVDSATPSRNPLSSPACSLDRLLIRYGNRRILVSPQRREAFLALLAQRGDGLVVNGDRVTRAGDAD